MEILKFLEQFITQDRVARMRHVVDLRTRYISLVLENLYQPHNMSAVMRTCDCLGIQDIHILQGMNKYALNPDISLGSSKWLNIHLYEKETTPIKQLFKNLRNDGYKIVAAIPNKQGFTPHTINLNRPLILVMGSELNGLSDEAITEADELLEIPMYGFTESFNISVAAALILQVLRNRIQNENIDWQLDHAVKDEILLSWYQTSIKESELLIEEYHKTYSKY